MPELQNMDQKKLEEIRCSLIPMRYNNTALFSPEDQIQQTPVLDKIVLIVSGVVCARYIKSGKKEYRYLGGTCGDNVLTGLNRDGSFYVFTSWIEAVGEVEGLILRGDDLIRLISELKLQKKTR